MKKIATVLFGTITLLMFASCGNYGVPATRQNITTPANLVPMGVSDPIYTDAVNIEGYAFTPAAIIVEPWTTVTWTNKDTVAHNVSSDTFIFYSGNLAPGHSFSYTFSQPGSYSYVCTNYSFMYGRVIVQ